MSDDLSPVLSLPLIQPAQAQKHVTHNEALRLLDVLVQPAVASRSLAEPPPDPAPGARFIVPDGALGAWAGQDGALAWRDGEGWAFLAPLPGWQAHVADEAAVAVFDGTAWTVPAERPAQVARLGVGTQADATNRLAVAAPATLLTHDGGGHQLKLNKAAPADTASLLFQTGWSGRAEIGTAGDDDLALKVSADGSAWATLLRLPSAGGPVQAPAGLEAPALSLAGSPVLARATLLGVVGLEAGQPTGAVIERGSNASGDYVRLADGTQICTRIVDVDGHGCTTAVGALFRSDANLGPYAFPAAFLGSPHHVDATLHKSDNAALRNGAVGVRPRRGQTSAALAWDGIAILSALSAPGTPGEITRLSLLAVGRWA